MDVQMPDGTLLQGIPEGTTKAEIFAKYQKILGQPSVMDNYLTPVAQDMAKGTASGLVSGVVGSTLGAPADLAKLATSVAGLIPGVSEGGAALDKALGPVAPALSNLLDKATTPEIVKELGSDYNPGSEAGKFAKNLGSGVGGMVLGPAKTALMRVLAGLGIGGSEGAAQNLGGKPGEIGANTLASTVLAVAAGRTPRPVAAAQDLVKDVPPAELAAAAQRAQEASATLGTPTLLTQGLKTPTGMTALTQDVMQNPSAGAPVRRMLEAQGPIARSKIDDIIQSLTNQATDQSGANRALAAGDKAITRPQDVRTQLARALYRQAGNDTVPGTDILETITALGDKRNALNLPPTSDSGRAMTQMERKVAGAVQGYPNSEGDLLLGPNGQPLVKPTPVLQMDTLRKEASAKAAAADKPAATGADIAKKLGQQGAARVLRETTQEASPALAAGQNRQSRATAAMVDPMNTSVMTDAFPASQRASGKGDFAPMVAALEGNGSDISKDIGFMADKLKLADPKAFPLIAKKWLEGKKEAADQLVQGRENPDFLNSFVDSVAGPNGSTQRGNFLAVIKGVAKSQGQDPEKAAAGANKLMDALQVAARERGSLGRVDTSEVARAAGANPVTTATRMASLLRPFWSIGTAVERHVYNRAYTQLADALTSADGLQKLQKIADFGTPERTAKIAQALARGNGIAAGEE